MNVYEEKQAQRKAYYEAKAEQKRQMAIAEYARARELAMCIPFGQPILVGHHSEKKDRAHREKITRTFDKSYRTFKTFEYYERKAQAVGQCGISSDDPDAIEKLKAQLAEKEKCHEKMKLINKALRKGDNSILENIGLTTEQINAIKTPDVMGNVGFASYSLQNSKAGIRRIKDRIAELEKMKTVEGSQQTYDGFIVEVVPDENRIRFVFDTKPSQDVCRHMRKSGFVYSRTYQAWQRKITVQAKYVAEFVIKYLQENL